ncbi:MAG: indole-3-glycerol phosphate synthase TrpC [Candidatus Palauibacterales bacterium]|nr:indole-3-glycerol phosphate synthase TrpC [Candidatus Palauibacterales bacterium]
MILDDILEEKEREVDDLRRRGEALLLRRLEEAPPARSFRGALAAGDHVSVIAEFKRRSPSAGDLAADADPVRVGEAYRRGGAAALSVLTDGPHFGGRLEDLRAAREASGLPVLRKDFIIDPLQVLESRGAGADAVLLIVRALDRAGLGELLEATRELGMDALVEVHDREELEAAVEAGAGVIGVNARDLSTFEIDLERCEELVARVPGDRVAVAESGIGGPDDVARMGRAGADAVLVGSTLMRRGPDEALAALTGIEKRERGDHPATADAR